MRALNRDERVLDPSRKGKRWVRRKLTRLVKTLLTAADNLPRIIGKQPCLELTRGSLINTPCGVEIAPGARQQQEGQRVVRRPRHHLRRRSPLDGRRERIPRRLLP
jgi:hypothetical protein